VSATELLLFKIFIFSVIAFVVLSVYSVLVRRTEK
jgi:hypothetical protein